MIFEANHPFTGDVQKALDFIASFLVIQEFDIERRSPVALVARRLPRQQIQAEEQREAMQRAAVPVRGLNRIEVRYEAAALWAVAESRLVTSWRRIAIGMKIIEPLLILPILYGMYVGHLRDDEGHVLSSRTGWILIGVSLLFAVAIPSAYVSLRNGTRDSVKKLLDNAAVMAGGKGQG